MVHELAATLQKELQNHTAHNPESTDRSPYTSEKLQEKTARLCQLHSRLSERGRIVCIKRSASHRSGSRLSQYS